MIGKIISETSDLLDQFGLRISPKNQSQVYVSSRVPNVCEIVKALSIGAN